MEKRTKLEVFRSKTEEDENIILEPLINHFLFDKIARMINLFAISLCFTTPPSCLLDLLFSLRNKSLLKEAFCPKGRSFRRVNRTENMNMLRQDLQTVLFILSPLEILRPFLLSSFPTIPRTTKAEPVTFCG